MSFFQTLTENIFGFTAKKKKEKKLPSIIPDENDDGSLPIEATDFAGYAIDFTASDLIKNEVELITRYREISLQPELEHAIDEIVNEAIAYDEEEILNINTDKLELSKSIKKKIHNEFEYIKNLLDFNNTAYKLFRQWYIDGRLYFIMVIDEKKPSKGILELKYIDPRKIKKVKEYETKTIVKNGKKFSYQELKDEYYIYNEKGFGNIKDKLNFSNDFITGKKISKDVIVFVPSGIMNETNNIVISYLHKAIKALNQLRTMEDSLVIYRLARAPERRVFYIDVGNLPKAKAEAYIQSIMLKHRNSNIYDPNTGKIHDKKRFMPMLEDYWFPRRSDGKATEVTTLPGGENLGNIEDILYFQQKLNRSLNIPVSRLEQGDSFGFGRASEISRDELKFQKFINRLRKEFSKLFYETLKTQLILKKIVNEEDWNKIKNNIHFIYAVDNHFTEIKNIELLSARFELADSASNYVGADNEGYFSREWMYKNVFRMSEEDIKIEEERLKKESSEEEPTQDENDKEDLEKEE